MARRDTAQDSIDRPHYYSQYWLDIATGKQDIADDQGVAEAMDLDELEDDELIAMPELPAPKPPKKPTKVDRKAEPSRPTFTSLADLANIDLLMKNSAAMEGDEVTDLEKGTIDDLAPFDQSAATPAPIAGDVAFGEAEDEAIAADQDEDEFGLDFDEEEEEDEWGGRKPGKGKPKPPRRERRPNF